MIKITTKYQCEICHKDFTVIGEDPDQHNLARQKAIDCWSRGVPEPIPHLVGLIWFYRLSSEVLLALPSIYGDERIKSVTDGHFLNETLWATRNNGKDDLWSDYCSSGNYLNLSWIEGLTEEGLTNTRNSFGDRSWNEVKNLDFVRRMVEFLNSQGITAQYVENCRLHKID